MHSKPFVIIVILVLFYFSYRSVLKYISICKSRNAYRKLKTFASLAENNLNGDFLDICVILSNHFGFINDGEIDKSHLVSSGFRDEDADRIMEYTIKYRCMDIYDLRRAASEFIDFSIGANERSEAEYQKNSTSLLCAPAIALIALILVI